MKKTLALLSLALFCTPLLAATIPFTNATQCTCILKHQGDHFLTCSNQGNSTNVYVGNIINTKFSPTNMLTQGQISTAPITADSQGPAVAYNFNGSTDFYESADLSFFHNPNGLTLVQLLDPKIHLCYPVESRCINTQTCTYIKSDSSCLHANMTRTR